MLAQVLHQVYGGGILAVIMHHRSASVVPTGSLNP